MGIPTGENHITIPMGMGIHMVYHMDIHMGIHMWIPMEIPTKSCGNGNGNSFPTATLRGLSEQDQHNWDTHKRVCQADYSDYATVQLESAIATELLKQAYERGFFFPYIGL